MIHYKNSFELTALDEGHVRAQGVEAGFSLQTSSLNLKLLCYDICSGRNDTGKYSSPSFLKFPLPVVTPPLLHINFLPSPEVSV
jgi:hypothetical protein